MPKLSPGLAPVPRHRRKRKFKIPVRRRYLGIKDLRFYGWVFAHDLPEHPFTVALLDEAGREIFTTTANEPCDVPGIPSGHGFSTPIPSDWLLPTAERHVQFRILETNELFPRAPRPLKTRRVLQHVETSPHLLQHQRIFQLIEEVPRLVGREALVVGTHELTLTGAPLIILEIVKQLRTRYGLEIVLLSLRRQDVLHAEFAKYCSLIVCDLEGAFAAAPALTASFFAQLRRQTRCPVALVNSLVSGELTTACHAAGFRVKALVHEYGMAFQPEAVARFFEACSEVIFPCRDVCESFAEVLLPQAGARPAVSILPQGCYMLERPAIEPLAAESFARAFREQHELLRDDRVVAFCGTINSRKGFDWMISLLHRYARDSGEAERTRFLWIGRVEDHDLLFHSLHDLEQWGLSGRFIHLDEQTDVRAALGLADLLFLCSRIDPFPSVVLEAFLLGKPVIGFDRAQGCRDLIRETGFGRVVRYQSVEESVRAIDELLADHETRRHVAAHGPAVVRERFQYRDYVDSLHAAIFGERPLASVEKEWVLTA